MAGQSSAMFGWRWAEVSVFGSKEFVQEFRRPVAYLVSMGI